MLQPCFLCFCFCLFNYIVGSGNEWKVAPSLLSSPRSGIFVGYDIHNQTIWLLGGNGPGWGSKEKKQAIAFNVNKYDSRKPFTLHETAKVEYGYTVSQSYTQKDDVLYVLNKGIATFNLTSQEWKPQAISAHDTRIQTWGECIAHIDNYLIISQGYTQYIHIYDIDTNEWILKAPHESLMSTMRVYYSCIVVNQYLYEIGGWSGHGFLGSVEKLFVGDIPNIDKQRWLKLRDTLSVPRTGMRSVVYGKYIYVIDGVTTYSKGVNVIEVIDVCTDKITPYGVLEIPAENPAVIIVDQRIYVFGGGNKKKLDSWQYHDLPEKTEITGPCSPQNHVNVVEDSVKHIDDITTEEVDDIANENDNDIFSLSSLGESLDELLNPIGNSDGNSGNDKDNIGDECTNYKDGVFMKLLKKHNLQHICGKLERNGWTDVSLLLHIDKDALKKMDIRDSDIVRFKILQKDLEKQNQTLLDKYVPFLTKIYQNNTKVINGAISTVLTLFCGWMYRRCCR